MSQLAFEVLIGGGRERLSWKQRALLVQMRPDVRYTAGALRDRSTFRTRWSLQRRGLLVVLRRCGELLYALTWKGTVTRRTIIDGEKKRMLRY